MTSKVILSHLKVS